MRENKEYLIERHLNGGQAGKASWVFKEFQEISRYLSTKIKNKWLSKIFMNIWPISRKHNWKFYASSGFQGLSPRILANFSDFA